jgi:hypothetical protein
VRTIHHRAGRIIDGALLGQPYAGTSPIQIICVAPLELPVWLDAAIPTTWLVVLGAGAWAALRGSPAR